MPIKAVLLLVAWILPAALIANAAADPPPGHPAPDVDAPGLVRAVADGLWTILWWAAENPKAAGVAALLVLVPLLAGVAARAIPRPVQKDQQRMFTANQRRTGFARAGGRCEAETVWFLRCRAAASHGDHWYPWTLGGATTMGNFVAMCPRHNTSKGAKVPTFWQTWRLGRRRRGYFPAHMDVHAGDRTPPLPPASPSFVYAARK
ncbi:hypothetical protein [Nocardioides pakistanensis]